MSEITTKHANFRRLAEARTNGVLEALRKLSNLASPNYEYEEAEIEKIYATIEAALVDGRARFAKTTRSKPSFSL